MPDNTSLQQQNRRLLLKLGGVVLGMFGFAFALVPLYDVICDITGLNGKTSSKAAAQSEVVDEQRTITVEFIASVDPGMPWAFKPAVTRMQVHPGEIAQVSFHVENPAKERIVGQAIPSVTPGNAASHFMKTECFCFNQQALPAGGTADLPLIFYIDPALPESVNTVTLSYTLFNITDRVEPDDQKVVSR